MKFLIMLVVFAITVGSSFVLAEESTNGEETNASQEQAAPTGETTPGGDEASADKDQHEGHEKDQQ